MLRPSKVFYTEKKKEKMFWMLKYYQIQNQCVRIRIKHEKS